MEETYNIEKIKYINDKIFKIAKPNIIFIYTPPKVGSTTLVTTFRVNMIASYNIIHVHDNVMLNYLINEPTNTVTINDIIKYNACYLKKRVFVINVYRTSVERKMSTFFEKIAFHFNAPESQIVNYSLQKIIKRFNAIYPHIENDDYYFSRYDIPVECSATTFDHNAKYIQQTLPVVLNTSENKHFDGNITYVLLRLKDANTHWEGILSSIFGTRIKLINDYETRNKPIGVLYNKMKKEYRLPRNEWDKLKENAEMKFYLSEKEREEYINEWSMKLCDDAVVSYTKSEYDLYIELSVENRGVVLDYQLGYEHYRDEGCECVRCKSVREKLLKGECNTVKHNRVNRISPSTPSPSPSPSPKHPQKHPQKINQTLFNIIHKQP